MYRISELAEKAGLSRTALLYYEKIGLIRGERSSNGYRFYSDLDLQRLRLIRMLQAGGLSLKECLACLESRVDRDMLRRRLALLDRELEEKWASRNLLAGLLGEASLNEWHKTLDRVAPDAHFGWLLKQGFSEKEALRLRWLSKDMNEHEQYMADFMKVYETLERWGPGSEADTLRALSLVPEKPGSILEIGSGKGVATLVLARHTDGLITAVDNEPSALSRLDEVMEQQGLSSRVKTVCADMTDLPFQAESFDLIWSEGSAYIMGVLEALKQWKPLLQKVGTLVISDLVWLNESPHSEAVAFWAGEYPDMQQVKTRIEQIKAAGYELLETFPVSMEGWHSYIDPLTERVGELQLEMKGSAALEDLKKELAIYEKYLGRDFGYQFFCTKYT